jgi:hypothetical protein
MADEVHSARGDIVKAILVAREVSKPSQTARGVHGARRDHARNGIEKPKSRSDERARRTCVRALALSRSRK